MAEETNTGQTIKRVLVITYYWPPSGDSGVQRWVKFTKYLSQMGIEPVIYTPENPDVRATDYSLEDDIPVNVKVIKRHITEFYWIYRLLRGKKVSDKPEVNPINGGQKSFMQKLMLFLRANLFIPDPRVTWLSPSVKFLKKYLKEHPVDVIVSTGPPHSMHLIAMKLSKALDIPWLADFRDPWTKIYNFKHLPLLPFAKKKHHKLEKRVLDMADLVVTVSPTIRAELQGMTSTPVKLITNGYDTNDFEQVIEPDGYFNITHTGLLVSDGNPVTFWRILAKKCNEDSVFASSLRIRLSGKVDKEVLDSIKEAGLEQNTVYLGYQKHYVAVREQLNASVLILPLRMEPEKKGLLPGKLFEYLAACRTILCIGLKEGDIADVLHETKAGEAYDWDDPKMEYFIDQCWIDFKEGKQLHMAKNIEQYSRKSISIEMASLLKSLAEKYEKDK